jgi:hypothetical protein
MSAKVSRIVLLTACAAALISITAFAAVEIGQYQTREEFLFEFFGIEQPGNELIWIDDDLRAKATEVLGHAPAMLRVRYWREGEKTAWIIKEIGKEQLITFGIVINKGEIQSLRVLQFRESRGWEIRYPFFTQQFEALRLNDAGSLSHGIDSISGATLSVKAATRSAKFALVLDEYRRKTEQANSNSR